MDRNYIWTRSSSIAGDKNREKQHAEWRKNLGRIFNANFTSSDTVPEKMGLISDST
jgi:hypothetical protein